MRVLDRNNAETLEQAAPRRNERIVAVEATALGLVVLLGLGVRLLGLTAYGIWFDEGYHVALVRLPTVGAMLEAVLSNPPSDPLYVLVLRGWVGLFGHGDTEVRLLSVLLSTATLPAAYWLGRVMAGGAVGLLGALLFAVSPYAVELGQEAALYTLAALATTAALAAGWRWRTTGRGAGLYVLLAVVAIYSHYVVAVILALFALLAPVLAPRHPVESSIFKTSPSREANGRYSESRWAAAHALVFIAWLPWLLALGAHLMTTSLPRVALAHRATWLDVQDALMQYTAGTAARQAQEWAVIWPGLAASGALLALGLVAPGRGRRGAWVIAAIAAALLFLPAVVSHFTGLWLFVPHFLLFLLPALMVVLACGALWLLGRGFAGWALFGALLGIWLWVQVIGLQFYYRNPPHGNDGLRTLAARLHQAGPDDLVVVTPPALTPTLAQYYAGPVHGLPADFDLRTVYLPYDPAGWTAQSLTVLDALVPGHARLWLVYRPENDEGGALLRTMQRRYHQDLALPYEYATLYRFSVP